MSERPRTAVFTAALVLLVAGCVGGSPGASVGDADTSTRTTTSTATTTPEPCALDRPSLDASAEKPDSLTGESAESVALQVERAYAAEWLDAENATFFKLVTNGMDVTETEDGYEVTLEMAAHYEPSNSTIEHVNRPYTAEYVVTERSVARDGATLVCW